MDFRTGNRLIFVGTILTVVGLCIVIFKAWHIPGYWMTLIVGIGLLLVGLVKRAMFDDSRNAGPPPTDRR